MQKARASTDVHRVGQRGRLWLCVVYGLYGYVACACGTVGTCVENVFGHQLNVHFSSNSTLKIIKEKLFNFYILSYFVSNFFKVLNFFYYQLITLVYGIRTRQSSDIRRFFASSDSCFFTYLDHGSILKEEFSFLCLASFVRFSLLKIQIIFFNKECHDNVHTHLQCSRAGICRTHRH